MRYLLNHPRNHHEDRVRTVCCLLRLQSLQSSLRPLLVVSPLTRTQWTTRMRNVSELERVLDLMRLFP